MIPVNLAAFNVHMIFWDNGLMKVFFAIIVILLIILILNARELWKNHKKGCIIGIVFLLLFIAMGAFFMRYIWPRIDRELKEGFNTDGTRTAVTAPESPAAPAATVAAEPAVDSAKKQIDADDANPAPAKSNDNGIHKKKLK